MHPTAEQGLSIRYALKCDIPAAGDPKRSAMREMMMKGRGIWIGGFWAGCVLFALGQVISFYPGAERGWFVLAGLLCMSGLLIRGKTYRIASIILVCLSTVVAVAGHRRGIDYRKWLETQKQQREEAEQGAAPLPSAPTGPSEGAR